LGTNRVAIGSFLIVILFVAGDLAGSEVGGMAAAGGLGINIDLG